MIKRQNMEQTDSFLQCIEGLIKTAKETNAGEARLEFLRPDEWKVCISVKKPKQTGKKAPTSENTTLQK